MRATVTLESAAFQGARRRRLFALGVLGLAVIVALVLHGCGAPGFTSAMRPSGLAPDVATIVACDDVDRDARHMSAIAARRAGEGWRLVYVSEYTSAAIPGIPVVMCWEKAR
jgi:hypothetical protein